MVARLARFAMVLTIVGWGVGVSSRSALIAGGPGHGLPFFLGLLPSRSRSSASLVRSCVLTVR